MKLTKSKLKQIIKEELENTLKEFGPGHGGTNPHFTRAVARGEDIRARENPEIDADLKRGIEDGVIKIAPAAKEHHPVSYLFMPPGIGASGTKALAAAIYKSYVQGRQGYMGSMHAEEPTRIANWWVKTYPKQDDYFDIYYIQALWKTRDFPLEQSHESVFNLQAPGDVRRMQQAKSWWRNPRGISTMQPTLNAPGGYDTRMNVDPHKE